MNSMLADCRAVTALERSIAPDGFLSAAWVPKFLRYLVTPKGSLRWVRLILEDGCPAVEWPKACRVC